MADRLLQATYETLAVNSNKKNTPQKATLEAGDKVHVRIAPLSKCPHAYSSGTIVSVQGRKYESHDS